MFDYGRQLYEIVHALIVGKNLIMLSDINNHTDFKSKHMPAENMPPLQILTKIFLTYHSRIGSRLDVKIILSCYSSLEMILLNHHVLVNSKTTVTIIYMSSVTEF